MKNHDQDARHLGYDRIEMKYIDDEDSGEREGQNKPHQNYATFSDGKRRIDYVLVYEDNRSDTAGVQQSWCDTLEESTQEKWRRNYEGNLKDAGLQLEIVDGKYCGNKKFVLLHIPIEPLFKEAENLGIEKRVKTTFCKKRTVIKNELRKFLEKLGFFSFEPEIQCHLDSPLNQYDTFRKDKLSRFEGSEDKKNFFSSADRIYAIYSILNKIRFDRGDHIGIEHALKKNVYCAAFPLHEFFDYENLRKGLFKKEMVKKSKDITDFSCRQFLYWFWAKQRYFYKFQPFYLIKEYFGSKIAFYFIFFGKYTNFLILLSVFGCVFVGWNFIMLLWSSDVPSNEICSNSTIGGKLMCPTCDHWCDYTLLKNSCLNSRLSYIFNNLSTVIFGGIMSIGATIFIELWKRKNAYAAYELGLLDTGYHEESIRLEYRLECSDTGNENILNEEPPAGVIPVSKRIPKRIVSFVTVLIFVFVVIAVIMGTVYFRFLMLRLFYPFHSIRSFAPLIIAFITSFSNLLPILALSYLYNYLAFKMVEWEYPRLQSEFETSYIVKVFLFQFTNYYAYVLYVALLKGNFSGLPGRKLFGLRPEDCDLSGCMVELAILLGVLMLGKIAYNVVIGFFNPVILTFTRGLTLSIPDANSQQTERKRRTMHNEMKGNEYKVPRWEWDYALTPFYDDFLFNEYLDIVIQFGFVTLFITIFPLAPLLALVNNIIEIRVDAYKFTVAMRRPVPQRAKDIGVWLKIIDYISKIAVLTNALLIAFTTDFIPRFVYGYYGNGRLEGFVGSTLSLFKVHGLNLPRWTQWNNATECWFRGYRFPPCSLVPPGTPCGEHYESTPMWWIILSYRLGFVILFTATILVLKFVISWAISDMPSGVLIPLQQTRSNSHSGAPIYANNVRSESDEEN